MSVWLRRIFLFVVAVFILAPLVVVLVASVSTDEVLSGLPSGFTMHWLAEALSYPQFQVGFQYSVQVAAIATACSVVLGTAAAYALYRLEVPGTRLLRTLFIAPLSMPRVVSGFCFFVLFASLVPAAYGTVGGVAFAHVLILLPFVVSLVGAGLATLDSSLEEAARDLGASAFTAFRRVTLPQIRASLLIATVFAFLTSFDEVDLSVFLMPADTTTLPVAIFLRLQQNQDPTTSAVSSLMIVGSLLLTGLVALAGRKAGLFAAPGSTAANQPERKEEQPA
ncbi:putative spermidine/putrescine transport system permease protein [Amycolatopsis sulphurea]|uniref:Putative spermidine/putrescine transport system permease protein n=1 Tax=Amycolatopsis sulphurea TaxID=76022 RepID=A0A2A9G1G5_9PSEU|nr:ABC transporter permease [Amycolatopsis sulphurea]PFG57003.1 putative spermidine/putrescine transport system permease protein [Amycolatopsis sulphurea]